MAKPINDFKNIADSLVKRDSERGRDAIYQAMSDMRENNWTMPDSLKALTWITPHIDPTPRNAIIAGKRAYATMAPNPRVLRPGNKTLDRERYEQIEALLRFHFRGASQRQMHLNGSSLVEQAMDFSMTYGAVVGQVVHIDAQTGLMGNIPPNKKRAMKNDGDFIINFHHPMNINVRMSEAGLEGVLLKKSQTIAEFVAFWGEELAKPILERASDKKNIDNIYVHSYDWMDYENRAVWASLQNSRTFGKDLTTEGYEILVEEHDLEFLPWAVATGAEPLLYGVYKTDAWNNKNIKDTLLASEVVSHAAAPRYMIVGPTGEVDIGYGDPSRIAHVPPGHTLEVLAPPPMDQNLQLLADRDAEKIRQSTAPNVVVSLDVGANEAGYTFNQRLQSGLQTFATHKRQVEAVLGDLFCHMLYWSKELGKPIEGPRYNKAMKEYAFDERSLSIDPETFEYNLKIDVTLKADTPVDRTQQLQSAAILVRDLGVSLEFALELLEVEDPHEVVRQSVQEQLNMTKVQGRIKEIAANDELKAQLILAGKQQMLAMSSDPIGEQIIQKAFAAWQQAVEQQKAGSQPIPPGEGSQPNPENTTGIGVGGEGLNPAVGGTVPAAFSQGAGSQPVATGLDTSGEEL